MTSRRTRARALPPVLLALAAAPAPGCAPAPAGPPGRQPTAQPRGRAADPSATPRPALPREPGATCPIPFEDADVVLARVGATAITACDVAVAAARATREGRPPVPPRALLAELVADALLAAEAEARGLARAPEARRRVDATLAAAVLRAEALAAAGPGPDDAAVERYYAAHASDFATPERAHLREVVLAREADARAVLRDAAAGVPFDQLVRERTVSESGRRDEGDLGLVPAGGNDRVPADIAAAGFALSQPGEVHPRPVRVQTTVTEQVGRRRRRTRTRTVVTWHVVQLLGRVPGETTPLAAAEPRIRFRLRHEVYQAALAQARQRLLDELGRSHPPQVDTAALQQVRIEPATPPAPGR